MARPATLTLNEDYFNEIDSPNKAYILCFIYADGNINKTNLTITIAERDMEILNFIKKELEFNGEIKVRKIKNNNYASLIISRKKLIDDLKKIGVVENKTYISKELPIIPNIYIRDMIRGLFDGDGSIYSNTNIKNLEQFTCNFSSNKFILIEISNILKQQGISTSKIRYRHNNIYSGSLDIRGSNNIENFINWLYYSKDIFSLTRKLERTENFREVFSKRLKFKISEERIEQIIKLYNNGMKQFEIGEYLNIPKSSIRGIIQKGRKKNLCI